MLSPRRKYSKSFASPLSQDESAKDGYDTRPFFSGNQVSQYTIQFSSAQNPDVASLRDAVRVHYKP